MPEELASNFSVVQTAEAFFTGGPVQWTRDGSLLFTICGGFVKTFSIDTGKQRIVVSDEQNSSVTCICLSLQEDKLIVSYANLLLAAFSLKSLENKEILDNSESGYCSLERQWKSTHRAPILVMEFNDAGVLLATGSADFTVKVWDLKSQYCTHTLKGGQSIVSFLLFDAQTLFAGYGDGVVRWNDLKSPTDSGKRLLREWKTHNSQITGLLVERKDKLIVASRDQTIVSIDLRSSKKLSTVPVFEAVQALAKTVEGSDTSVVTIGEEGKLKVWDLKAAKPTKSAQITTCDGGAEQLLSCPQRWLYLVVCADHTLMLVSCESLAVTKQYVGFNQEILSGAYVGPLEDGCQGTLAVAATSPQLRLYNTLDWSCQLVQGHLDNILTVDSCSWNRSIFASGSKDNTIRVWLMKGDKAVPLAAATGHTNNVSVVKLCRLGKVKFLLSASADTTLKVWPLSFVLTDESGSSHKVDNGKQKSELKKLSASYTMVAHLKEITAVDVSPNDRLCATASLDKSVKLWHINTDKLSLSSAGTITGHKRGIWDVKFSNTDQVVATASGDCTVKIFALSDRSCVKTFEGHPSAVLQVRFLSGGQQLLSTDSGGLMKLWTIRSNECVKTLEAHQDKIWMLLVSNDQKHVVTGGSDGCLHVWEDATEKEKFEADKSRREKIAHEQELSNLLEQTKYSEALRLALHLARPFSALKVIEKLIECDWETNRLRKAIKSLRADLVSLLLNYASEWNTNSRNSHVAQRVLFEVLNIFPPNELLEFPNISSIVESFLPYTKRHFDRLTRAKQQATFLDYTWQRMRLSDTANK